MDELTPDETTEQDAIFEAIWDQIRQSWQGMFVLDTGRAREFIECANVMKRVLRGRGLKIQTDTSEVGVGCGTIRAAFRELNVKQTAELSAALKKASNYEIYPKTDGSVMLAVVFYGLANRIKE